MCQTHGPMTPRKASHAKSEQYSFKESHILSVGGDQNGAKIETWRNHNLETAILSLCL